MGGCYTYVRGSCTTMYTQLQYSIYNTYNINNHSKYFIITGYDLRVCVALTPTSSKFSPLRSTFVVNQTYICSPTLIEFSRIQNCHSIKLRDNISKSAHVIFQNEKDSSGNFYATVRYK